MNTYTLKTEEEVPVRLIECFAYYMGFLNNINVPAHKIKVRSERHIKDYDRLFIQFKEILEYNKIDWNILKFTEVTDDIVGYIHDYYLKVMKYENKTYNNKMALLSTFVSHVIDKFNLNYKNPFLGAPNLNTNNKIQSIKENEFGRLLDIVAYENRIKFKKDSTRKNETKINMFRPWLKDAYWFGLFTGGRSDDIVLARWCDIVLDENEKFDIIHIVDHKENKKNSHRVSQNDSINKDFAITAELGELLYKLGYEEYRDSNKYILAPNETVSRTHIGNLISRSFSHFYKQLNTGKEVTFRNLRKTYASSAYTLFGAASTALTGHKHASMIDTSYHDKTVTIDKAKESFSVFKKK